MRIEFTLNHVEEDVEGGPAQLRLRHQGDLQERADHRWDKVDFVVPCNTNT